MKHRLDMSDWVIHFIHEMKSDSIWTDEYGNIEPVPVAYGPSGEHIFAEQQYDRDIDQIWERTAYEVLNQIIEDGYLHTSWSYRGRHNNDPTPTVYGPRSAVCFTEMPLHALINYEENRRKTGYVAKYALALKKDEFFSIGGRPVIYGLTGKHKEAKESDPFYNKSSRNLAASCGISLEEQYRYVAMSLGGERLIDWSHEREWRWTKDYYTWNSVPGLPLWLLDSDLASAASFSEIIIFTETEVQSKEIIDKLREYHDYTRSGSTNKYSRQLLKRTRVTSFEKITTENITQVNDIIFSSIDSIHSVKLSKQTLDKSEEAYQLAYDAAAQLVRELKRERTYDYSYCGRAYVITDKSHSEALQALVKLKRAKPTPGGGYRIDVSDYSIVGQNMELAYAGARCAAKVLEKELGIEFWPEDEID